MKKALLVLTLAVFAAVVYAGDPVEVWNVVYDSGSTDQVEGVAVDALGNVYVTGLLYNGVDTDYLTIKYNPDGDTLWTRAFDGGNGNDNAYGIAVDASSNVYVTGSSNNGTDFDFRTICYDNATPPNVIWNVPFDGGNGHDMGSGVAVDETGNVYVAGRSSNGTDNDWRIIKYDLNGDTVWTRTFDSGSGDDGGRSVALDAAGNPCVTGYSFNGNNSDFRTICYDSEGNVRWNEFFDGDSTDSGYGIAVDASGYVYVIGTSDGGTNDYRTIKYDSLGNIEWNKVYDGGYSDFGHDIAVDPYFVYVTGNTDNGADIDLRTIRYDKESNEGWNVSFDSGNDEAGRGVAVDDSGYVYVTGLSHNGTDWDFRTIKYQQDDYPVAVSETPTPLSLTLEVVESLSSAPTLRYAIPTDKIGILTFYTADGRKVDSYTLDATQSSITWDEDQIPAGVYFAELTSGSESVTVKAVLIR